MITGKITYLTVTDVRFPTSLDQHGSDAMHTDPDYSAAYVVIETDSDDGLKGHGLTFTLGKGTEVVVCAVKALSRLVIGKLLGDIVNNFRDFYRQLTSDGQLRWIGPEKGAVQLATAAVLNAVWDLWAKKENKPLWKLLVDMSPRQLLSCIDFRYITDVLTEEEAFEILQKGKEDQKARVLTKGQHSIIEDLNTVSETLFGSIWDRYEIWSHYQTDRNRGQSSLYRYMENPAPLDEVGLVFPYTDRRLALFVIHPDRLAALRGGIAMYGKEEHMVKSGYPAYTTSCAWLGYSDKLLKELCSDALKDGWTRFKVKVGADLKDDIRRCELIRHMIGPDKQMMLDANQRWDVNDAIKWVKELAVFKPLWIEEPTSPDDILGHATISKELAPLGIGVATGEQCHNRVMFKQFLQANALQYLQIDSCRLGSVNENLSVLLMAKKFNIPVCPHAGGVGLCELVQHLIIFDYISVSGSLEKRMCEYVDHLHEHFKHPVIIKSAAYMPPKDPGYSTEMKEESVLQYQFPEGAVWQKLILEKKVEI